jgi:hypothetical protein
VTVPVSAEIPPVIAPKAYAICGPDTEQLQCAVNRRLANIRAETNQHFFEDTEKHLDALIRAVPQVRNNPEVSNTLNNLRFVLGDLHLCHEELIAIRRLANFALHKL